MKVFISWSGKRSEHMAEALRTWLPDVIQTINPWMSKKDIDAGARWAEILGTELDNTNFGIICLTKSNVNEPWILFESGAISKKIGSASVCPYLIDLKPADLPQGPLAQFQAIEATKEGTFDLLNSINNALGDAKMSQEKLQRIFEKFWPDLNKVLTELPEEKRDEAPKRTQESMIEEILETVREISRSGRSLHGISLKPDVVLSFDEWSAPPLKSMTIEEYKKLLEQRALDEALEKKMTEFKKKWISQLKKIEGEEEKEEEKKKSKE